MIKRVYWVQYYALVNKLCKFLLANRGKLPEELRTEANTLFNLIEAVCLVLQAYDNEHSRGRGASV